jgi:hypothetical protein
MHVRTGDKGSEDQPVHRLLEVMLGPHGHRVVVDKRGNGLDAERE